MQRKYPENIAINTGASNRAIRGRAHPLGMRILSQTSSSSLRRSAAGGGSHNMSLPEHFGPGNSGSYMNASHPRSLNYYGFRGPYMPPQSTPMQQFNFPSQHETFGSNIDYNLSWLPTDIEISNPIDPSILMSSRVQHKTKTGKHFTKDPNTAFQGSSAIDIDDVPASYSSKYLLKQSYLRDAESSAAVSSSRRSPKKESLMEWFDRTVEKELQKRREASLNVGENVINFDSSSFSRVNKSKKSKFASNPLLTRASTSGVEIQANLRLEKDTELLDAVDKLATAEAMCAFEGAVKAAEEAAASAPPELAEEAAAAGAQDFQAELTGVVRQQIDGVKPVEVIGYVGVTRPNKPKKS